MQRLLAALILTSSLSGCIPLVIGGYIGYQMSERDHHLEWCADHVGELACADIAHDFEYAATAPARMGSP